MTAVFKVGDVFDRMSELEDDSVDLVLTSPPFLALRSYLPDGDPNKDKEIGSEPTPADYLDVLLRWTAECRRVLAPHGSLACELGDTYSKSGGAGGDYDPDGLRAGQPKFRQSRNGSEDDAWPLPKSLVGVPQLYMLSLAYGRNILTGQESPAGMWRVRNVKPWIRTNPPVGALGDKERPATSYVIVACTSANRYFDLDAVRTGLSEHSRKYYVADAEYWQRLKSDPNRHLNAITTRGDKGFQQNAPVHPAGAPPRDWWHQVDAIIDAEIDRRAGKYDDGARSRTGLAKASKGIPGGDTGNPDKPIAAGGYSVGARGVHIRRALEQAGILETLEALDISPRGYSGAHYAVFPKELVRLLVDEMAPRRVCTVCGEPSRRIVGSSAHMSRQPELAAHLRERRLAAGLTMKQVNDWFPGKSNWCGHWEDITSQPLLPTPEQWAVLEDKLDLDPQFNSLIEPRSTVDYLSDNGNLPPGQRRTAFDRGGVPTDGSRTKATRQAPNRWSDCGHNTWRPGLVLDPFVGSGTTLEVCTPGFDCIGIDIDPRNADLAAERVGMFLEVDEREVPA